MTGLLCALVFVAYWSWFCWDQHVRYGPMHSGNTRHRRYLESLRAAAVRDAAHVRALSALTPADRSWLADVGWTEPAHAQFVRVNGLDVDQLLTTRPVGRDARTKWGGPVLSVVRR